MYSFLILSFIITPIANFNIFISVTSISFTCFFLTATISSPYTIAGLTTELYTFPFTLAGNLLSQITTDTLHHLFHPACTLLYLPLSTTAPLILNNYIPLLLALLYPPSSLFLHHFLHLCTDIRSLTYLLSSLFFPMHTSRILVSALLPSWSLRKSQYHQHTASFMVVLSLLHLMACPLSLQTQTDLMLIPGAVPTLTLKLSVVPTAHITTVSLPSYISCTSRTYFSTIPDFLI